MTTPIEDYAVLGDTATCALVGRDGSIDWLCLPRFDSAACFAALLGSPEHGRWLLGPSGSARTTRGYVGDSAVLETVHQTDTGAVKVTDFMPLADGRSDIVRRVEGLRGTVRMRHEWVVRFSYGKVRPWVHRTADAEGQEVISAVAGPDMLVLRGERLPRSTGHRHVDEFDVTQGETVTYSATWFPSWQRIPAALDAGTRLSETIAQTSAWVERICYQGPYRDLVVRSLLVLRMLTHSVTGGIVAAPTSSLPEEIGGERNWDYRFCWLRDASMTVEALLAAGFTEETLLWRNWLLRAVAGDPAHLQIMYAVDGARDLPERELAHLPGYAGSAPVRVGNGAVDQKQTDVLGEVMVAFERARLAGLSETDDSWALQRALVENLATHWDDRDNGLWEIRGPLRHFTHSRVMVWAAFDCAIAAVDKHGKQGPVGRWRELRDQVRAEILEHGFDRERGCFTQHYETREVDASLLMIPMVGFLEGDDPRVLGTIAVIEQDLMVDGLLLRYRTESGVDGLAGAEHPFLVCSFWLVNAYVLAGRVDDARALMDRLAGLANDVGLLSEEYDPGAGIMTGNFPQAFSHLGLVGAALSLARCDRGRSDTKGRAGADDPHELDPRDATVA